MLKRPISPHLQIYKIFSKEMTSGMSITHRFAEIGIFASLIYLCVFFIIVSLGENPYNAYISYITSWFGKVTLCGVAACLWYYVFGGIRYTFLNMSIGLNKKSVMVSGYLVIIISVIVTAINWYYIILFI